METNEEQVVPRPEGYTIVKYFPAWEVVFFLFLPLFTWLMDFISSELFHFDVIKYIGDSFWLMALWIIIPMAFVWLIMRKFTEVKVNLKIKEEGLEQTRLSGSKLYPKYRMIRWEEMKHYYPQGRHRYQDFSVSVKHGQNLRISVPWPLLFEKQKDNYDNLMSFIDVFWDLAPQHDVHRGFWL